MLFLLVWFWGGLQWIWLQTHFFLDIKRLNRISFLWKLFCKTSKYPRRSKLVDEIDWSIYAYYIPACGRFPNWTWPDSQLSFSNCWCKSDFLTLILVLLVFFPGDELEENFSFSNRRNLLHDSCQPIFNSLIIASSWFLVKKLWSKKAKPKEKKFCGSFNWNWLYFFSFSVLFLLLSEERNFLVI